MKRRDFLKASVLAGVGSSLPGTGSAVAVNPPGKKKRIIIGGAGISGLCCGYQLTQLGHDVVLLEASGRHGGHVFTGRDGLSDGLYADFGADHITKPGYEHFFAFANKFNLTVLPYPHAEGSDAAPGRHGMRMINGKFYTDEQLADPAVLKSFGLAEREVKLLSSSRWSSLAGLFLEPYTAKINPESPLGSGHDELDQIAVADLYKKEGASEAALRFLGGKDESALFAIWRRAVMRARGIPDSHGDTYHLKGGNQELPNAFARELGDRVKLAHTIVAINRTDTGVTVTCRAFGREEEETVTGDVFVNCIPLPIFRKIPVTPSLSANKQYVVDHLSFSSHPFYVFEASSRFWLDDGFKSINMEFEHPDISSIWEETNEVRSSRIILKAYAPGGVSAQRGLAAFREVYPGKKDTIVQALTVDWTKDKFAPTCEMEAFPVGEMNKFWPELLKPDGRIYFAGTYADSLSRGMESCLRSAQRVANEVHNL